METPVEVPEHIVEEEKTTDMHVPVWALAEQDWAREGEGMRALCPETGSREQARQASGRVDRSYTSERDITNSFRVSWCSSIVYRTFERPCHRLIVSLFSNTKSTYIEQ